MCLLKQEPHSIEEATETSSWEVAGYVQLYPHRCTSVALHPFALAAWSRLPFHGGWPAAPGSQGYFLWEDMMRDLRNSDYLAGFADGEGCFIVTGNAKSLGHPRFTCCQRSDKAEMLYLLQKTFGGSIYARKCENSLIADWTIRRKEDVQRIIHYFDSHPLIRKQCEFLVWREAAYIYFRYKENENREVRKELKAAMEAYKSELSRLKRFDQPVHNADFVFTTVEIMGRLKEVSNRQIANLTR